MLNLLSICWEQEGNQTQKKITLSKDIKYNKNLDTDVKHSRIVK